MPDIYALQEKYKDEIAVISVNRGQKADTARNFLREVRRPDGKTGVSFSVNGLDPTDILYERYRGLGMPLSVFVDRSGMVTEVRNGIMSEAEMERAMDEALSREVQG
jgi:hypothetical protein